MASKKTENTTSGPPPGFFFNVPPPGLEFQMPPPGFQPHLESSSSVPTQVLQQPKKHRNRKPSGHHKDSNKSIEECILCCQKSDVFGIGPCRHPACIECIIRMRCLGDSKTCHACREEIKKMYLVVKPSTWENYTLPQCNIKHPDCDRYQLCFENTYTAEIYDKLNAFSCHVCQRAKVFADFPNFAALKNHMGTEHRLFFCHICSEHLNILPKFRRTFNEKELELHMTGKKNVVQGVKGHPKCEFCNSRYYDNEELYKHSRKEHYFCGVCAETGLNQFFKTAAQLHKHYKQKHHPCLEADCESAGIVFSNEFDLNVHNSQRHGANNRRIPINFEFSRAQRYGESSTRNNQNQAVSIIPSSPPLSQRPVTIIPSAQSTGRPVNIVKRPPLVEQHEFPTLSSINAPNSYSQGVNWRANVAASRQNAQRPATQPSLQQQINSNNYFPTLGPSTSRTTVPKNNVWSSGKTIEVIKKPPPPKAASPPKPQRKKIIPLPEVWTENMRQKLEAREQGLPEPPDLEPPLPQPSYEVKKKEKKPKKKTVGIEALKQKLGQQTCLSNESTATKFNVLAEID